MRGRGAKGRRPHRHDGARAADDLAGVALGVDLAQLHEGSGRHPVRQATSSKISSSSSIPVNRVAEQET